MHAWKTCFCSFWVLLVFSFNPCRLVADENTEQSSNNGDVSLVSVSDCDKRPVPNFPSDYEQWDNGTWRRMPCAPGTLFHLGYCGCGHVKSENCDLRATSDPRKYIKTFPQGGEIVLACAPGLGFAEKHCSCTRVWEPINGNGKDQCPLLFLFIFDQATQSYVGGASSTLSNDVRFLPAAESTGAFAASLTEKSTIKIWILSRMQFSSKWGFQARFKLEKDLLVQNGLYDIFGEGNCLRSLPVVSFRLAANPARNLIRAWIRLNTNEEVVMEITNLDFTDWVIVGLSSYSGFIRLRGGISEQAVYIGAKTLLQASCPLVIGSTSSSNPGIRGFVDKFSFYNCFSK